MRRITIWLTTALTVAAMAYYYNLSLSGDGKDGDGGQRTLPPAAPTVVADEQQATASSTPSATPDTGHTAATPTPNAPAPTGTPRRTATSQPTRTATPQPHTPARTPPATSDDKTGGTPKTHVDKDGEQK